VVAVQILACPAYILALLGQNVDPPTYLCQKNTCLYRIIKATCYVVNISNYSMSFPVVRVLAIFPLSHSIMPDRNPIPITNCVIMLESSAQCQWAFPAGAQTTSPVFKRRGTPPLSQIQPLPVTTLNIWPFSWVYHTNMFGHNV
jgi:hypothetical protein